MQPLSCSLTLFFASGTAWSGSSSEALQRLFRGSQREAVAISDGSERGSCPEGMRIQVFLAVLQDAWAVVDILTGLKCLERSTS